MADLPIPSLQPGWHTALTLAAFAVAAIAAVVALVAFRRERALARHYTAIMTGAEGVDLAAALEALAARTAAGEGRLEALESRASAADERLLRAIRHVRVLRYSAFHESGGDQSYAVALLDDRGDGVVLSGLVSRTGTRVFAKPVASLRSDFPLTHEEERVIEEAGAGGSGG
jgi:hypothetical protein